MAYFIVIGTDNSVQTVVDEIRKSHLQHNVVTSGCVIGNENSLSYQWDVYNVGEKNHDEKHSSINLRDALSNQIAQFRSLLPANSFTHVFLIGSCKADNDADRIKFVYDELCEIVGARLSSISIDIILLGYNLEEPDDVTQRPYWRKLKKFRGIENGQFKTDVLYINNLDYYGAANNLDSKLLGRFISHWAKFVSSNGNTNPKQTINTNHYAIGLAERQYNFDDIAPFFRLAAEECILDRALNDVPSPATQQMLDNKYYKYIDLHKPWIDGLCHIYDDWESYCTCQYDYSIDSGSQPYSLNLQQQQLGQYLNGWLKLYCRYQQLDIDELNAQLSELNQEIEEIKSRMKDFLSVNPETGEDIKSDEFITQEKLLDGKNREKDDCQKKILIHKQNIENNSFADEEQIRSDLATGLLTDSEREDYKCHVDSEKALFEYLHTDDAVNAINEAIRCTDGSESTPECPVDVFDNVGRLQAIIHRTVVVNALVSTKTPQNGDEDLQQKTRSGCIGWFAKLFHNEQPQSPQITTLDNDVSSKTVSTVAEHTNWQAEVVKSIKEFRKVKDVHTWWEELSSLVEEKKKRWEQCLYEMDGEIQFAGTPYEKRVGGFAVPFHRKSVSLINMDMVRNYRDTDTYFKQQISVLKSQFFDSTITDNQRQSMHQLIKDLVIDELQRLWHTLYWDGKNPFCNENFTPQDIHNFIEDAQNGTEKQSKPFVEYVGLDTQSITQKINYLFYFSHPKIEQHPTTFRSTYNLGNGTLTPVFLKDFTNSLCEVQVIGVTDYVDNLGDFKPKTETQLNKSSIDYSVFVHEIVGHATTIEEKTKAIYDWLCHNIAYDTTLQIHDADRCWKTKRGVCQAYCELFVHFAKLVGVTADIVTGVSKDYDGNVSDQKHAWIFVYTHGYDGMFIDPTWGAGYVKEGIFIASPNDTWFNVDPDWMIFTHFSENPEWNKYASAEVSREQFELLQYYAPLEQSGSNTLYEELSKIPKV